MNREEIERCQSESKQLVNKPPQKNGNPPEGQGESLKQLARQVGASTRMVYVNSQGKPVACDASVADLIDNIHKALQTATMIDMAKTAAGQTATMIDMAKTAGRNFRIAVIASLIATLSMFAAWLAALKN
jgi:hypothetical protein